MKILVILAHPDPASFNHAIAKSVCLQLEKDGHTVLFHDLYQEGFDPVLPGSEIPRDSYLNASVKRHCTDLQMADGVIIIHPNWWGMPPAILKGWIDRIIRPGIAYRFIEGDAGDGVPVGLLQAKAAIVITTSNTRKEREETVFGDPLQLIWKQCVFGLCGVLQFHRLIFRVVITSSLQERVSWLNDATELTHRIFPEST